MIDIYKFSTIEICWLSTKIEEMFSIIKIIAQIEELMDVDRAKVLSKQDLTFSSEIAHIKAQLNNLSSEPSKLIFNEQEILKEEEWIHKIQEDLTIQYQNLIRAESKLKYSLNLKEREAKQVKSDLAEARFSKL